MKNPYDVLGVAEDASVEEIKTAFRNLAKVTHPDVHGGDEKLTARFREVADAYAILSDPEQREKWDENAEVWMYSRRDDAWSMYYNNVRSAAASIEYQIHMLYQQYEPYRRAAKRSGFVGMAWLLGGLFVTFGTLALAASEGGSYVIAWGPILFGGIQAARSFSNHSKISAHIAAEEAKIWEAFK